MVFEFIEKKTEKADYLIGGDWSLLKKAWKHYAISKGKDEYDNMKKYARKIREIQKRMGLKQTSFTELNCETETQESST